MTLSSGTSYEDSNSNNSGPNVEADSEWYLSNSIYINALVRNTESLLVSNITSGDVEADSIMEVVSLSKEVFEKGRRSNGDVST